MGPIEVKHGGGVTNHDSSIFALAFCLLSSLLSACAATTSAKDGFITGRAGASTGAGPAAASWLLMDGATYSERVMPASAWPFRLVLAMREGLNVEKLKPLERLLLTRDFCK